MHTFKRLIGLILTLSLLQVHAGTEAEPRPMRLEALTEGRDFSYNTEAFINRLSYRWSLWDLDLSGDGTCGFGGSVKSNELYLDIFLQKTLRSDSGLTELILKSHRFEDFDGRADHFIVGLARHLTPEWKVAILSDIFGDKSETDVYFETHWTPGNDRLVKLGYVLPDAYYNTKKNQDYLAKYDKKPQSWYLHYREGSLRDTYGEIILDYSPKATFKDPEDGMIASGEQVRLTLATGTTGKEWQARAAFSAEWAERQYTFSRTPPPPQDDFDRQAYELSLEAHAPRLKYWPRLGARHLYLKEDGWFGDARDISGRLTRREPAVYGGGSVEFMKNAYLEPMLYLSWANIDHIFDDPSESRDVEKLLAKLTLNVKFIMNEELGAYVSISPSFHLHKGSFGGGSIKVVWPF